FVTLIRTHHITSRKKLHRVKKAAAQFDVPFVLVRYGGCPGLMYGESPDARHLTAWVSAVKDLRYKDFQCVWKPEQKSLPAAPTSSSSSSPFVETESVSEFGRTMEHKGLSEWFKLGL
ncbi:hypothetical protein BD289DRAFT_355205, partial [Coniella lustricola]